MELDIGVIISALINFGIAAYVVVLLFSYRSYFWHKTEAIIIKSELKGEYDSDGDIMYGPEIEYEYTFDGKKYTNNYVSVAIGSSNNKSHSEHILGMFGKGWKVDVYVNPKQPTKSILAPGIRAQHLMLLVFLIFGLYFWVPAGWNFWGYVFDQNSVFYKEEIIPVTLDTSHNKDEIVQIIRNTIPSTKIKTVIRNKYSYLTPMAMDKGFQLKVKASPFSKSVQVVCSFRHETSVNYTKVVTKECTRLVNNELKKLNLNNKVNLLN